MRTQLLSSALLFAPAVVMAAPVTVEQVVVSKGAYRYEHCEASQEIECQCSVDISYPRFKGLKNGDTLSAQIKKQAEAAAGEGWEHPACGGVPLKKVANGATQHNFGAEVMFENENIFQMHVGGWFYGATAAHGNPYGEPIIYDKQAGKRLSNSDIFYEQKLNALNQSILATLKKDEDWYEPWDERYNTVVSPTEVKGDIYIKDNRLKIEVHPSYPVYVDAEVPLEFIKHPAIRALYQEQKNAH